MIEFERVKYAAGLGVKALLNRRNPDGLWHGQLSSSSVSTAVAAIAIHYAARAGNPLALANKNLIERAVLWLKEHQNIDGGWGDTVSSPTNLSATLLSRAAILCNSTASCPELDKVSRCVTTLVGEDSPAGIYQGVIEFYGRDLTFSSPILLMCALSGQLGNDDKIWSYVPQLPFELAIIPQRLFKLLNLPVVSYAIPALIAVGLARRMVTITKYSIFNVFYRFITPVLLRKLLRMQPVHGGFLEAAPLTGFVAACLSVAGFGQHETVNKAVRFLSNTVRTDGSWPIDTNLSLWLTAIATRSLRNTGALSGEEKERLAHLFRQYQFQTTHPFTLSTPGGWAWTTLPGGVPDADDTAGILNALAVLQPGFCDNSVIHGLEWLLQIQNRDGGIPTFCRGWGLLPFDRSCPDISAHALLAFHNWQPHVKPEIRQRLNTAGGKILRYLERSQLPDGSWLPLWFGDQNHPERLNPVYGTGVVIDALSNIKYQGVALDIGVSFLLSAQNSDGGWGGGNGLPSNVECTGIAAAALCAIPTATAAAGSACNYLCDAIINSPGNIPAASPIGLYFAALWYDEELYPLLFALTCLNKYQTVNGNIV